MRQHSAKLITALTRFPEQELWDSKRTLIDLEHPGVSAWSLDYHVFTVGLNQGGVVHDKFVAALDAVYQILCVKHVDDPGAVGVAAPVVGDVGEAMFSSDDADGTYEDAFLVWSALMSWTLDSEAKSLDDTVVHLRSR